MRATPGETPRGEKKKKKRRGGGERKKKKREQKRRGKKKGKGGLHMDRTKIYDTKFCKPNVVPLSSDPRFVTTRFSTFFT